MSDQGELRHEITELSGGRKADDGHGPRYDCGWKQCGNPQAKAQCPFIGSPHRGSMVINNVVTEEITTRKRSCKHEWRWLGVKNLDTERRGEDGHLLFETAEGHRFYCIHCLEITEKILEHISMDDNGVQQG